MILDHLTGRQQSVLRRLCAGLTNAQIAEADGTTAGAVANVRTALLVRCPRGMTFPEICAVAAEEDPTIVLAARPRRRPGRRPAA